MPFPSPGNLPDSGIEPRSPALQADALPSEPPEKPQLNVYLETPERRLRASGCQQNEMIQLDLAGRQGAVAAARSGGPVCHPQPGITAFPPTVLLEWRHSPNCPGLLSQTPVLYPRCQVPPEATFPAPQSTGQQQRQHRHLSTNRTPTLFHSESP